MSLRVIGAGLGCTGTRSLKLALERLLDGPCHHVGDLFHSSEQIDFWNEVIRSAEAPDWNAHFSGYAGALDEPVSIYWRELMETYPDAIVLLSVRNPRRWWERANATVFEMLRKAPPSDPPLVASWHGMARAMMDRHFPDMLNDRDTAIRLFKEHNQEVRDAVPQDRLVEWKPGDGWMPLCMYLDVPIPIDENQNPISFPRIKPGDEWQGCMPD